jgi:hypothetical protein
LGSVSFRAKNTLHKLSICNKMTDMVSLIELLRSKYPKWFPVYLKNTELTKFLNENREEIEWENFRELRDFYAKHAQTRKFYPFSSKHLVMRETQSVFTLSF